MARVSKKSFIFFRLSPDAKEVNNFFAIRRGEIKDRLDAEYFASFNWLGLSKFPISRIEMHFDVRDGDHSRLPSEELSTIEEGVRYLRAQDLNEGEITSNDPIYISHKYFFRIERSHIKAGDLLFSVMASIGNSAIVPINFPPATANRAVGILSPLTDNTCLTWYLFYLFTTELGTQLYTRIKKGGLQRRTNLADVQSLEFPLPPPVKQIELVAAMDEARSQRKQKLAEADALLSSLDDYLLNILGLEPPVKDDRKVFAIQTSIISGRFDPHFHAPNFKKIYRLLSKTTTKKLGEIVQFSKDSWNPKDEEKLTFCYIEISNVKPQTGEAIWTETLTKEAPSRARMLVHGDDIIVSLTRPHHGSIAHLSEEFDGCIASTGFAVIRSVSKLVNREYLWCILRSQLSLQQMLQRSSGGNYPAITKPELENIIIPIPEISIQEQIVAEIQRRRSESQRLRSEAESGWQAAKQWFEEQLLGGS